MIEIHFYQKKKYMVVALCFLALFLLLIGRLVFIMIVKSAYYSERATNIEQRTRQIKAARGKLYDRNGKVLADNRSVCTISVIYHQVEEPEQVIQVLSEALDIEEAEIRKKVEKISSRERIASNVAKEIGDQIREQHLAGVKVDEDYKRYYLYGNLASRVFGFTGSDNQGIVGLEAKYDAVLQGTDGEILTFTDFQGVEIENAAEERVEPIPGDDLHLTIDYTIQKYVQQEAERVKTEKQAKSVSILLMNPQNGEIYASVSTPEYDLNDPFTLLPVYQESGKMSGKEKQDALNEMWRNPLVSDTYEPGSTFKIVTAAAALEQKKVTVEDTFSCPGFRMVEDRRIRCHKTNGHGAETFREGFMNSCNPVFMEIGARVGAKEMLKLYRKIGLYEKTGVDAPGEANSIMHPLKNIGAVELATMSFGQSIQITPLQLLRAASAAVNGGSLVTPHYVKGIRYAEDQAYESIPYEKKENALSKDTAETLRSLLEAVVAEGTGKNAQVVGYRVGGKTATSEKLPRGTGRYISSFVGFAPADQPYVIGLILIDEPKGVYYGGTIAAPVMGRIFQNILPYLAKEK